MYNSIQFTLHNYPSSPLETMNTKKNQNAETIKRKREEEEEEEEKKIDTFFKLIKNYQEARKRRREELAENSENLRKKSSKSVVPAFQPEDFSQCRVELKPLMHVSDHKEENVTKVKDEKKEEKKVKEEKGLDLNLAL